MWHSKEDIVKDLAFLNDFGDPDDKSPYKMLYSAGRGSKIKGKTKTTKMFNETGEGQDLEVLDVNEVFHKSKGRGALLANRPESSQLLQQLRLVKVIYNARPMGSSDQAVESYYGKNKTAESSKIEPQYTEATGIFDTKEESESTTPAKTITESKKKSQGTQPRSNQNVLLNNLLLNVENLNYLSPTATNEKVENNECNRTDIRSANDSNCNYSSNDN